MSAASVLPGSVSTGHEPPNASSKTSLATAKRTLTYLVDPTNPSAAPTRFRTRALLRTFRYLAIFIFWRVVRYAKYAATGALIAAASGTVIGSMVTGVGFIAAPPTIFAGTGVGLLWGIAKFGWRRATRRTQRRHVDEHSDPRADERADAEGRRDEEEIRAPRADPW
ncbi:hypothetical protein LTR66_000820 [Elasticomyces elasticus]|nr:hypothetical protein LTR66_000820 [Elasticomyces elasticus]